MPLSSTARSCRSRAGWTAHQRGLSLVELMVGVAIGLFILAAATLMVGNQLSDNRRLLLETQLQQDMRASLDIMTRQIRRAGGWDNNESLSLVAAEGSASQGSYIADRKAIEINPAGDEISIVYWLNRLDNGVWGFRLRGGVVQTRLARGGWQDLTDANVIRVTSLKFTPISSTSEAVTCHKLCPDGTTNCWPRVSVRAFRINLQAEAVSDPQVKRQMQATARVRNDLPVFEFQVLPTPPQPQVQPCPP
jgi:prepilin-type N-terminal cleavage/methylation domain-containing protein